MPSNLIKELAKKRIVNICDASIHIYHIVNEDMAKMRFLKLMRYIDYTKRKLLTIFMAILIFVMI